MNLLTKMWSPTCSVGIMLPAGAPKEVVDRLNAEFNKALGQKAVRDRFEALSLEAQPQDRAALRRYVDAEAGKWGRLVRDNGIKAD